MKDGMGKGKEEKEYTFCGGTCYKERERVGVGVMGRERERPCTCLHRLDQPHLETL